MSQRFEGFPPGYAPRRIPYDDGPAPPGYHVGSEPRPSLWVTGTALLLAAYVPSFLVAGTAFAEGEEDYAPLFVPVAGPWIAIRTTDADSAGRYALVISGLMQLTGAGLVVAGVAAQRDVFVRNDVAQQGAPPRVTARVSVGPGNVSVLGGF